MNQPGTEVDLVSTTEAIRLHGIGRANTRARWLNLWRMWQEGKSFAEMGRWIGRHPSTVKQLLKRGFRHMSTQPGFEWPRDAHGRKICDVPHPAPRNSDYDTQWTHVRSERCKDWDRCKVCGSRWFKGKTLVEVFEAEAKKRNDHTRTS